MALIKTNARSATALDATILTGNLPAISGANLITLNASNISSGTLNSARFTGGKILSVTTKTYATQQSSTSSTMATMNLTTSSITPASASSEFLCFLLTHGEAGGSNVRLGLELFYTHGSTTSVFSQSPIAILNGAGSLAGCVALHGLADPDTTESIVFGANFDNQTASGTSVQVHANNYTSRLTVLEYA